jgi:hypothetical protein
MDNAMMLVKMMSMMTPTITMSQKIATESTATKVSFTCLMLNMLGDRLRNVPKNCKFHSPFDSKGRRLNVPLTKALALMKKIKKDSWLHRYENVMLQHHIGSFLQQLTHFITTQTGTNFSMPTVNVLHHIFIHITT